MIVGASDFGGGWASRVAPPVRVTAAIQAAGFAFLLAAVWLIDAPSVTSRDLVAGAVAGLAGALAFLALYAAFSRGQVSVLAPTAAVVAPLITIFVGWLQGEGLTILQGVGIAVAMAAVALVTQDGGEPAPESDGVIDGEGVEGGPLAESTPVGAFALAVLSGVLFAIFFLALAETDGDAGLWPLIAARVVAVPLLIGLALVFTRGVGLDGRPVQRAVVAAGIAEAVSSVLVLWAYQRGPIAVAAVFGAFYPFSTVALARVVFNEELRTIQWIGVALAFVAMPLMVL